METYLKYFVLMLAIILGLSLLSCGGGNNEQDQVEKSSTTDIISGSVSENKNIDLINGNPWNLYFFWKGNSISIGSLLPSEYTYVKMVSVGNVTKLSDIKTAPAEVWDTTLPLSDKNGYIITYTYQGKPYYIRLFITLNISAAGDTVGINYQFQYFTPAQ